MEISENCVVESTTYINKAVVMLKEQATKIKEYEEVLRFYADEKNWGNPTDKRLGDATREYDIRTNCIEDGSLPRGTFTRRKQVCMWRVGGRRARKVLGL